MKKRLLSALLALLFAVSLIPVALAAPKDLDLAGEASVELNKPCEIVLDIDLSLYYDKGSIPKYEKITMISDHAVPGMGYAFNLNDEPVFSGTPTSSGVYDLQFLLSLSDGGRVFYNLILTVTKPPVTVDQTFDLEKGKYYDSLTLDLHGISGTVQEVKLAGDTQVPGNLTIEKTQNGAYYAGTVTKAGTYKIQAQITFANGEVVKHNATLNVAEPSVEHSITVENCSVNTYTAKAGDEVQVYFYDYLHKQTMDRVFDHWEVTPSSLTIQSNEELGCDTFIMPDEDVTIVAVQKTPIRITVENGTADYGIVFPGETQFINADEPSEGQEFSHWEIVSGNVTLENRNSPRTSFVVGDEDVTVKAVYITRVSSVSVTGVTLPVAGEAPTTEGITVQTPNIKLSSASWDPSPSAFEAGNEYTLYLLLTTIGPYNYSDTVTITVNGLPAETISVGPTSTNAKITFPVTPEEEKANPFTDVSDTDLFYDAVMWAYYHDPQITDGMTDTTFGPKLTVTRGQCVTFLWRAMGKPMASSFFNPFQDVAMNDYYYDAVLWAVEKGITNGVTDTTFAPNDTLSTQHIITFLYRTLNPGKDGWDGEAAAWAGKDDGGKPFGVDIAVNNKTDCPRWCVVQFLYKVLNAM